MRAVWRRLLTDPESGTVGDYGTTRYRPPTALADLIRARDRHCYAPGCRQPAARCDLDHLKNSPAGPSPRPDPDGVTSDHNRGPGCPYHHRVKTHPDWNLTSPEPGTYLWTTPTGHTYRRDPEPPLDPPIYDEDYPTLQPADLDRTEEGSGDLDPTDPDLSVMEMGDGPLLEAPAA